MSAELIVQGRTITAGTLGLIRDLLRGHHDWNRTRLSRELCGLWDWRNERGQMKDMACRTLLLKLERRGLIELPPRSGPCRNAFRNRSVPAVLHSTTPIACSLSALGGVEIRVLGSKDRAALGLLRCLVDRYHYLGLKNTVGENLKYLVTDSDGRELGCVLFGSAAWSCRSRDAFLGWDRETRKRNLQRVTNNTRFLILPWVRVPHLASHVLSRVAKRVSADWVERYGHPIHLLETFVERERFRGTCYRAANWLPVGATTGRSRNDRHKDLQVPVKDVFVYPLTKRFRQRLTAGGEAP